MELVKFNKKGHVGILTINRPPMNALNINLYGDIADGFERVQEDPEIWVVVLQSNGKHFSVGNDMADFNNFGEVAMTDIIRSLRQPMLLTKPLVVAVQGAVMGAAMGFVSAADILIAEAGAYFCVAEINIGLVGVVAECFNSIPIQKLRYMALTGDRVSAADMERCGFVHKLVEREALAEEALQIAEMIAAKPPLSVRRTKISLQNLVGIHELLSRHAAADYDANTYYLKNTEDHKEAYTAFLEKRTPVFKGK